MSHTGKRAYSEGAAADVACVLTVAGAFLSIELAAAAGELEKCCVLHFEIRRMTLFAGLDRSMVKDLCV